MAQSQLPFPSPPAAAPGDHGEPAVWLRRVIFVESPAAPIRVIRHISFRAGLNIVCTEPRLHGDTKPIGHSVGKSLLVRIIRYCLGEDRFCSDTQRLAIAAQHERAFVLSVWRVGGEDWAVARPLGLDSGYADSWCTRSRRAKDLVDAKTRLKYREFIDALNAATNACYAGIDLPNAKRRANWRDLLGWLSRDQDCHFDHHAEWRLAELQAGPRALTREDAYFVMRMALGLLGPEEIGLLEKHGQLRDARTNAEERLRECSVYLDQAEARLRAAVPELAEQPAGELFGVAFANVADSEVKTLTDLLKDPDVLNYDEMGQLQDALSKALREEGSLESRWSELDAKEVATRGELESATTQDASTLLASLQGARWKCSYFARKDEAMEKGCPGKTLVQVGIADPWREERIRELAVELEAVGREKTTLNTSLDGAREKTKQARQALSVATAELVRTRDGITRRIGLWHARSDEAERYSAAWRERNSIENGRDARQKKIDESAALLRAAREHFESQKAKLSAYYDEVLKKAIAPAAVGRIDVDGDGVRPQSNSIVADSGTTLRQYADVLGFDLACLAASVFGVGHLPRFWIHDSPRQADSEEELYHSVLRFVAELERAFAGRRLPNFQYILTTTSPPPEHLNKNPFVRVRLHARVDNGKLLRFDFGKGVAG